MTKKTVTKPRDEVSLKQRRFCQAYVKNNGNGLQAARAAGYKGSDNTLSTVASENLRKPNIKRFLAKITAEAAKKEEETRPAGAPPIMCESEALTLTSILGRACITDLLDDKGQFDIQKARKSFSVFAIKRLTFYRSGKVKSVELRDKNGSLELMGKHHGLWTGEITDPDEVLARFLKRPKHLLPASVEPAPSVPGQILEKANQ